jgi:signal transduction histidine kinase
LSVLGTLAAGISHELRNPLSVVVAQAKLLENELVADKPRTRLNAIVRAAEHCAAIVRAFLDQSRSRTAQGRALRSCVHRGFRARSHRARLEGAEGSAHHRARA